MLLEPRTKISALLEVTFYEDGGANGSTQTIVKEHEKVPRTTEENKGRREKGCHRMWGGGR